MERTGNSEKHYSDDLHRIHSNGTGLTAHWVTHTSKAAPGSGFHSPSTEGQA